MAEVGAGVAWTYLKGTSTDKDQVSGSAAILFNNGFNLAVAGGHRNRMDAANKNDADFYYFKVGQKLKLFSWGGTNISADYGRFDDYVSRNDEGDAYGVQLVQNIDKISTELYVGYRYLSLDNDNNTTDYDSINSVLSGFRFRF